MKLAAIIVFLILLFLSSASTAQETTGHIEGMLVGEEGTPVPYVAVTVTSPNLLGVRGVASLQDGFVRLMDLPVGMYRVEISHIGYRHLVMEGVPVNLGRTTNLGELALEVQVHELPPVVVAADHAPLIDPESFTLGANLRAEEFADLPVQRDYRSVASLLPHANESYLGDEVNIAGSTGLDNKYFIDGVDTTDPYLGITGTSLPYNFVREVQVRSGAYEAEYSSALGGVMNVVTYSGSNDFKGNAFGFFLNNRFTAEPRQAAFEPSEEDFSEYDVGISLGGPIIQDKLWLYVAYNPTFTKEDVDIPGQGIYEDSSTSHRLAGKLDWHANDHHSFALIASGDPTQRSAVGSLWTKHGTVVGLENPDPYLYDIDTGSLSLSLQGKHLLGERILLKSGISRFTWREDWQPTTQRGREEILFVDRYTGIWSGGAADDMENSSTVTVLDLKASWLLGQHTLKGGIAYKDNDLDFNRQTQVIYHNESQYRHRTISNQGAVSSRTPSAFLQDSWRLSERMRLNFGIRWDGQFLVDSNGDIAQRITDQWQPRIGFAYQPGKIGTQKIFGSFGRYYQEFSTHLSTWYHNQGHIDRSDIYGCDPRICADPPEYSYDWSLYIQPEVDGLEGQYFDEGSLGYERQLSAHTRIGFRGIHRVLGNAVEDGYDSLANDWFYDNPGHGHLSEYPKATHEYSAFELSYQYKKENRTRLLVAYVLSRNYGNYPGLYNSDFDYAKPNANGSFDYPEIMVNSEGKLPNDRTHVFKLSGTYQVGQGLTIGAAGSWQSGTPKNEWGGTIQGAPYYRFIQQRGTAGRTPSIWDLNLRASYALPKIGPSSVTSRLLLDVFHIGSRREAVLYDMVHYFGFGPNEDESENPTYNQPLRYQPPMAMRLGLEVDF